MVVMLLQNAKERIITFIWKKWQEGNQTYSSINWVKICNDMNLLPTKIMQNCKRAHLF